MAVPGHQQIEGRGNASDTSSGSNWRQSFSKRSEEEQATWELQQQKREKLSNLMGQYLLKGYRMLGTTCSVCGNILLQTQQGVKYCVQCEELDKKGASSRQQQTQCHETVPTTAPIVIADSQPEVPDNDQCSGQSLDDVNANAAARLQEVCVRLEETLVAKLQWTSEKLSAKNSTVEESTQLCVLIKACAEALKSVQDLENESSQLKLTTS